MVVPPGSPRHPGARGSHHLCAQFVALPLNGRVLGPQGFGGEEPFPSPPGAREMPTVREGLPRGQGWHPGCLERSWFFVCFLRCFFPREMFRVFHVYYVYLLIFRPDTKSYFQSGRNYTKAGTAPALGSEKQAWVQWTRDARRPQT